MTVPQIIFLVCVVVFTAVAAVFDARIKRLPNALTVPAFFAGILFTAVFGPLGSLLEGVGGRLLFSLGGFGVGFGILFVLWIIGGGGGGDVKFMGALGAWLGPIVTFEVLVVATAFSAIGSMAMMVREHIRLGPTRAKRRYISRETLQAKHGKRALSAETRQQRMVRRRLMPFGVPAALATWCVLAFVLCQNLIK
ncbi:MAG TPA: A24 family peptidase [Thermoguttaceae bacterium]|nr:A24 family peptidase [Thermoguttaceae bacterium]